MGSAPIAQGQMVVAVILAIIFLGETLNVRQVLGIVLIMLGPSIVALNLRKAIAAPPPNADPSRFSPRLWEGYSAALLSLLGYGLSPVLISAGLAGANWPILGGLVAYLAAAIVFIGVVTFMPGGVAHAFEVPKASIPWYLLSGILVFLAQMLKFLALGLAPVVVVVPIHRLGPIALLIAVPIPWLS